MAEYTMIVLTNPVEGKEEEYNRWYDEQHAPDVCAVPGFTGCDRYELHGEGSHKYAALYSIDSDDVDAAMADLNSRAGTDKMPMSDALDMNTVSMTIYKKRG